MKIDIKGMDKYAILAALYNNAKVQGLGIFQFKADIWTAEDAKKYTEENYVSPTWEHMYFDYVNGRVMKICLDSDVLDTRLYDRDNGEGWGLSAIWDMWLENNHIRIHQEYDPAIKAIRYLLYHSDSDKYLVFAVTELTLQAAECTTAALIYPYVEEFIKRVEGKE